MPEVVSREGWGARPAKSNPGGFTSLDATVCHYTAAAKGYPRTNHGDCYNQVRSIQNQHLSIPNQSDIEYNHLGCNHGVIFQGRMAGVKGGANGTADSNKTMPSFCVLLGVDDIPSQLLLDALTWWHAQVEGRAGRPLTMWGHQDIVATSCPGDFMYDWVCREQYHPVTPTPTPDPGDDMARIGPYLIQATGKDGTPNGAVYATDGNFMTIRHLKTVEELEGYRWWLTSLGVKAPELAPGAPIEPIDTIGAFGVVIE